MQVAVPHEPGPNTPQKLTQSNRWLAQDGVGPVQSLVALLVHGVCSSPQVHDMRTPAAPQAGNVVVVVVDDVAVVVVVVGQAPQSSVPPQPSESMPQSCGPQVAGVQQALWEQTCPLVQAETQVWLAPQVRQALESQVPQVSMSPQSPSAIIPHFPTHELGVQQVPKSGFAFPGGEAGFMQSRLQQLMFV